MTIAFLFVTLFLLLLIGAPIAIALGLSSVTTILLFSHDSLASLALWAGMRPGRAAALTLFVAAMQEGVQLLGAGRLPGWGEAFDMLVDAIAVALALFVHSRRRARRASHA